MSEYFFGVGKRRLTEAEIEKRVAAAKKHGARFIWYNGGSHGECLCGHGCGIDSCPIMSFWFAAPNLGEPFNSATASAVEGELS